MRRVTSTLVTLHRIKTHSQSFLGRQHLRPPLCSVQEPPDRPLLCQPPSAVPAEAPPFRAGPCLGQVHGAGLHGVQGVQRALPAGAGAGGEGAGEQDKW